MGVVDLPFVFDLESRMKIIQENEFSRMSAGENQWWEPFMKVRPSVSRKELLFWILSTATIETQGKGGNIEFDDMTILETDYTALDAGKGLRIRRQQFEDLDGNGVQLATEWTAQISAYAGYWPQKKLAQLVVNGEAATSLAYDKQIFFSGSHPNNGVDSSDGTYSNVFTGAASGIYPGALKIDESVTLDVAFANIGKAIAYIKSLKMPNGKDPRFLIPRYLVVPPALETRALLLTDAKYFALASTGGAGSADVEGVIRKRGLGVPVVADELGSAMTGTAADDTSWYIGCEQLTTSQLGAFVYVDREPFKITYYTGQGGGTGVDAILDRAQMLEWHTHGRNVGGYGHPYAFFKAKAA
jgi:hypothetical protein